MLAGNGHAGRIYELAGDAAFTLPELAAVVSAAGAPMTYRDMAPEAFRTALPAAGTPDMMARILSDTDTGIAHDALFDDGGDLSRLIGRSTTPYQRTIEDFVRSRPQPENADD